MIYLFYSALCLFLLVIQTTILPHLSALQGFYDFLIPFVIYLGLFRPVRESLPVIFALGFVQDNLSGGPFGIYMTAYFWIFFSIRGMRRFLHVKNKVFLAVVVVLGVLAENLIFIGIISMLETDPRFPETTFHHLSRQVWWAVLTGLFILLGLMEIHQVWHKWQKTRLDGERRQQLR